MKTISFPADLMDEVTGLIDSTPGQLANLIKEIAFNYAEDCGESDLRRMRSNVVLLSKLADLFTEAELNEVREA